MAAENSGPHPPPSWPEAPPQQGGARRSDSRPGSSATDVPMSWPESPGPAAAQGPSWPEPPRDDDSWPGPSRRPRPDSAARDAAGPTSWPEAAPHNSTAPAWPGAPAQNSTAPSWPELSRPEAGQEPPRQEAPHQEVPTSWPETAGPQDVPLSWPEASSQRSGAQRSGRPEQPPVPDPVPAWSQPPPQAHPPAERTVAYNHRSGNVLNDHAVPSTPMDSARTGTPPTETQGPNPGPQPPSEGRGPRPGSNLNRDPSDPDRPFVTAGQISGSRTPPPERQQELWNTVFGDNYQAMGDQDALDEGQGKPIWIYALGGSVAVALVAALLWAFLAGPLAGEDTTSSSVASEEATTGPPPSSPAKTSTSIGGLPKYPGKAAPVIGRVADAQAGISVPRLGGTWRLDERPTVKGTYGFDTRQYVLITEDKAAQLMSGPLSPRLASYYKQDDLEPVIRQVVLAARKKFFPEDNTVKKIAQQPIKVGDSTGRLIAYALTSGTEKATIVTMAVNTGGSVPAIVYMSIPAESKQLMPDIRTVMNQIRLTAQS
ncbi:hypothetical protein ABGB18_29770 [Nonomuraea sp. B12E4]|uniref:hypothetical protein n=1 Tax=Nonomuraea sp. B12E4 TaxID=3153564 RepID=UPI00325C8AFE